MSVLKAHISVGYLYFSLKWVKIGIGRFSLFEFSRESAFFYAKLDKKLKKLVKNAKFWRKSLW